MTLVALHSPLIVPYTLGFFDTNSPNLANTILINAAGEGIGAAIVIPKAGAIRKIGFRTATITTGGDVDCRVETLDAAGIPSGTLWAANTNDVITIAGADDNVWKWSDAFGADATVAVGDTLAIIVVGAAATTLNGNVTSTVLGSTEQRGYPHGLTNTASWAKSQNAMDLAVEYADGSRPHILGLFPVTAFATTSYNLNSSPDEIGMKFTIPFACKVIGVVSSGVSAAGTTFAVKLYDTDGVAVLASRAAIDGDHTFSGASGRMFLFTTEATLVAGSTYRVSYLPETATNILIDEFTVNEAATMEAHPMGTSWFRSTRTDGGGWTDTATDRRPLIGLVISALDDGAGGAVNIFPRRNTLYVPDPVVTL
jgi:hypothetical protein